MYLNTIAGASSNKKAKRVGRGIGSGLGKTCRKGHKGQKARAGGDYQLEGGQTPFGRRLPKFGFVSRKALTREHLPLRVFNKLEAGKVNLAVLKKAGLIKLNTKTVRVYLTKDFTGKGLVIEDKNIKVTQVARASLEAAGCSIVES